ncbi:aspartate/glutamate racemase family protein [Cryptosporangium sp. NPDC048952]|uniref:aspartate/glutamate racemase family protein n=1 Tax=Cryptosporangium sp. NPDC048952 TaxID=3363961 RepID=UPI003719778E
MLIQVVNPNTTETMTATMAACARAVAAVGTTVEAVTSPTGPASIESHYDEALAVPGLLQAVAAGERAGVDAYVVGCFGDPGVDAARELAHGPVIGIAEAAMRTAVLLGRTFSVVTTLSRTAGRAWELAARFGVASQCAQVRACEIPVLDLERPGSNAEYRITEECRRAVAEDEADVVVLGCAGMADLCARISAAVGVPVVDGVAAATKMMEGLVALGLTTSTRLEYARPPAKAYTGLLGSFSLESGATI